MEYIKIGKNAKNNFEIIDEADPDDLWFHLSEMSSAHGILSKDHITNENINLTASLIREKKSDYKKGGKFYNKKVKVEYLPIKYIEKTKITGEVRLLQTPKYIYV